VTPGGGRAIMATVEHLNRHRPDIEGQLSLL
jgi:hypothetical protein